MKSSRPRRLLSAAGTAFLSLCVFAAAADRASAAGAETVVLFNPAAFETPESIQFDRHGNAYLSLALTGEVRKVAPPQPHARPRRDSRPPAPLAAAGGGHNLT